MNCIKSGGGGRWGEGRRRAGERGEGSGREEPCGGGEVKFFRLNCNLLKQSKTYYALCITFGTRGCDVGINIL